MEKWPWQMARLMFNKDVTAYTLGYTFLTPIWGPSTQIRIFNFWNYLLFLHQRRFKTVTKTARSLRTGKGIVSSVVATTYESINRMRSTAKCINPRLSSTLFRVCNGYLFIYFLHSCLNLYELSANSLVINMFLLYCSFPVPLQWPAQRPFIENIIFCWINGDSALIMYLFNFPDWDPTVGPG